MRTQNRCFVYCRRGRRLKNGIILKMQILYACVRALTDFFAFRRIALLIVLGVALFCIPTFIVHSILKTEDDDGQVLYTVGLAEFQSFNSCALFKVKKALRNFFRCLIFCLNLQLNLYLTGIVFKAC